jgi:hypothetical protein
MAMPQVTTDVFRNFAGLAEIWGRVDTYKWYFHGRSGHWEFHLVEHPNRDPDCVRPQDGDYWVEGRYDAATQITNEQASTLAFECVRRYWEMRRESASL